MIRRGFRYLLPIATAISVVCALFLLYGYFASLGTSVSMIKPFSRNSTRSVEAATNLGRLRLRYGPGPSFWTPQRGHVVFHWIARPDDPVFFGGWPLLHSPWLGFYAESNWYRVGNYPEYSGTSVDIPNWCALLICLIAPAMWTGRRRVQYSGFAVITQESDTSRDTHP